MYLKLTLYVFVGYIIGYIHVFLSFLKFINSVLKLRRRREARFQGGAPLGALGHHRRGAASTWWLHLGTVALGRRVHGARGRSELEASYFKFMVQADVSVSGSVRGRASAHRAKSESETVYMCGREMAIANERDWGKRHTMGRSAQLII